MYWNLIRTWSSCHIIYVMVWMLYTKQIFMFSKDEKSPNLPLLWATRWYQHVKHYRYHLQHLISSLMSVFVLCFLCILFSVCHVIFGFSSIYDNLLFLCFLVHPFVEFHIFSISKNYFKALLNYSTTNVTHLILIDSFNYTEDPISEKHIFTFANIVFHLSYILVYIH